MAEADRIHVADVTSAPRASLVADPFELRLPDR
jgi:hypothetical protein